MSSIFQFTPKALTVEIERCGFPPYVGRQIARWIFQKNVWNPDHMTNIQKGVRSYIAEHFAWELPRLLRESRSTDGTEKYLLSCVGGGEVETVMIPSENGKRKTACISTQVGCNMGCRFCFTATQKKIRNLTVSEVVGQVLFLRSVGHAITHVVFMGMGEPLDNLDVTLEACEILTDPDGLGLGHRRVTVSTSGLVPALQRFMSESRVNIAISLHAPSQDLRKELMPISKAYPLDTLLDACRTYPLRTQKRITFEYVLLKGINDRTEDARMLVKILHGVRAKINLIPFNPFPGTSFERSDDAAMQRFFEICNQKGIVTTLRTSRGRDILAACGQLRGEETRKNHATV